MNSDEKQLVMSLGLSRPSMAGTSGGAVVIDVAQLFQGRHEIALRHGDAVYRLKITRFGKLILNK